MAVHFVYRCGYLGPTCLHRRTFPEDATVLDWFRRNWPANVDGHAAYELAVRLLGTRVAYFDAVLATISEEKRPPPRAMEDVASAIQGGYNIAVRFEDHCVQALTDDDEIDMAYYFFDDAFLLNHGPLAAYVLRDDWRLPDREGDGSTPGEPSSRTLAAFHGQGPGCLYTARFDLHAGEHLRDGFPVQEIQNVRVPDLCRWLMCLQQQDGDACPFFLDRLRAVLLSKDLSDGDTESAFLRALQQHPGDDLTWTAYADWTREHGHRSPGLRLLERALPYSGRTNNTAPNRDLVQVGDHIVQFFSHVDGDNFDQCFVFDDVWRAAHPALADALLRYTRWDFLSTGNEVRWD